jgi:hypothetical protein
MTIKKIRKNKRIFTLQEQEEICRLYKSGKGCGEIRVIFKCARPAIEQVIKSAGIYVPMIRIFTPNEINKIESMYKDNKSLGEISEEFNCWNEKIRSIIVSLGYNIKDRNIRKLNPTERECRGCHVIFPINSFREHKKIKNNKSHIIYGYYCRPCDLANRIEASKKVTPEARKRAYDKSNKKPSTILYKKRYVIENKNRIRSQNKERNRLKRKNDPTSYIRDRVSFTIRMRLKNINHEKINQSILDYFPYTIDDLKKHIESLFEYWMTWDNWGVYRPEIWKDNDSSTWRWQLDHIKPNSEFHYISMEDREFKECWALNNLRPYSAKLNIIEGSTRIRHQKKIK